MDYSYYPTQAQSYQFTNFPPTPALSYETQDEQSASAPDIYQNTSGFSGYDASYQFATNGFMSSQSQHQVSPPISNHRPSVVSLTPVEGTNGLPNSDYDIPETNGHRSSSEDKESMTPAQNRRKEQNRAAQRAFRERKERHVKDLETKLNSLSAHSNTLLSDNERLKRELQRLSTQNQILRATTSQPGPGQGPPSPVHGPLTYSPTDFQTAVGVDPTLHPLSFANFNSMEGERLLAAGAAWDFIQNHELFKRGMIDITDVTERLKGRASCDGRGPAFKESEVLRAIEESVQSGSDELI